MNYPTLKLHSSTHTTLISKIDDLLHQIFQYIETNEEYFKSQMDEVYIQYWEEIKTTAKKLYIALELDNYVDYIETCDNIHPEELSDVMYEALVDETPFELFYQLKNLKNLITIEGNLYNEIIQELAQKESNQTIILNKDLTYEMEKKIILLGYYIYPKDISFEDEDDFISYKPQPTDPYIIYKNEEDEIDGSHYLDGYYF
ncbi:hypothetical protein IF125_14095 [Empedobacter stercoris]|uniref:hypothetical protein n=1 Tax=Empedobacter stercoris TaxID=1628248 RepID=UPI001CE1848C|nr:hypothetical protein [Empedobacter stercoris]MCA4783366.1 hypothetical protein [Empedobacter stercoris]